MAKTSTAKRQRKPSSKLTYDPAAPMPSEAEALEKRADRKALRMADKSGDHKKKKQKKPKPAEGDAPAQVDTASSRRSTRLSVNITDGQYDADEEWDPDAIDESEDEGECRIETLQRAMTMRGAGFEASRVLVKWKGLPQEESTWEPRPHLHPEALQDLEWKNELPFTVAELLELPPHAPIQVLAREGLVSTRAKSRPSPCLAGSNLPL